MANNYSESSFMVPIIDGKAAEAAAWWWNRSVYQADLEVRMDESEEACQEWDDRIAGLAIEPQAEGGFWFSGDGEYFNAEAAIYWIQDYLNAVGSDAGIFFSWSSWCSKPRVHEFDGGGCVVTRDDVVTVHSLHAVNNASEKGIAVINY